MAARNGLLGKPLNETNGKTGERLTRVLPVHTLNFPIQDTTKTLVEKWTAENERGSPEAKNLLEAAEALRTSDIPVAFPTETVYGLGADATRSAAVQGIYKAKQRPSDNPLIVHVSSREQLQRILQSNYGRPNHDNRGSSKPEPQPVQEKSLIPPIYEPLINKFWPGPLTIILPNPTPSPLAPEVTSTLCTFGVRMPSSPIARLLIYLADRPLAAPSANASTRPSPTTAQHVYTDMQGRIDMILDGGPSGVGVESTVVDGLLHPPAILRPGGIGIEDIRSCPGWEEVQIGYKDGALQGQEAPRAPGMKYKHYSPKAKVVLFEAGQGAETVKCRLLRDLAGSTGQGRHNEEETNSPIPRVGIIRTKSWKKGLSTPSNGFSVSAGSTCSKASSISNTTMDPVDYSSPTAIYQPTLLRLLPSSALDLKTPIELFDIDIGPDTESIARGLFSALRGLDEENVSIIYVEGISDTEGELAAAIMNRLRKAAEEEVRG
ncbi:Sua5/YciO/YrdC/YwlC family tRNA threonylcarbamoyl adenosine modification protein [Emergomyces pasteurianus Ep9510]|uniref:Threonylcarbamoyl-AMP synthase n=1 Tax=Emergomyces pasteurianus Ep9510 TaxID=1447872 RepID=A0A1J9P2P0_9EURO|nr:Sua5/YciO/YrdC/YwlC family tRNA threonylcarbamoyl adenosine modification protein [Emergomyces pasteurianus Ep9510]